MKYATIAIAWLSLPIIPQSAIAAGISVSPARLDFVMGDKGQTSQNLTVMNPTADVQLFEVYTDDFANDFKVQPASFTLESGGRKTVSVSVGNGLDHSPPNNQTLSTNLSVISRPLAKANVQVGTGVKIPLTARFETSAAKNPDTAMLIAVVGLLGFLAIWHGLKTKIRAG